MANNASTVQLRAGNSSTSYANKATSTANGLAINALRNSSTAIAGSGTWHNGAWAQFTTNFGFFGWTVSCASLVQGWPRMYQACNNAGEVHWYGDSDSNVSFPGLPWAATFIR